MKLRETTDPKGEVARVHESLLKMSLCTGGPGDEKLHSRRFGRSQPALGWLSQLSINPRLVTHVSVAASPLQHVVRVCSEQQKRC